MEWLPTLKSPTRPPDRGLVLDSDDDMEQEERRVSEP